MTPPPQATLRSPGSRVTFAQEAIDAQPSGSAGYQKEETARQPQVLHEHDLLRLVGRARVKQQPREDAEPCQQ
jgi:hypothetical protein